MVSSRSVFNDIVEQIDVYTSKKKKLSSEIEQYRQQNMTVSKEQADMYDQLAKFYLPELDAAAVASTIKEKRQHIQSILEQKVEYIQDLHSKARENRAEYEQIQTDITMAREAAQTTDALVEEAKTRTANALKENAEYVSLTIQAKEFEKKMQLDNGVYNAILEEVPKQVAAYHNNRMFSYLLKRKFGTEDYEYSGLSAKGDKFVANVIDFQENFAKYQKLTKLPDEIKELSQKDEAALKQYAAKIAKIEQETEEKGGLPKALENDRLAEQMLKSVVEKSHQYDKAYEEIQAELLTLESTRDKFYVTALRDLTKYLHEEDFLRLREKARRTPSQEDDGLVSKIEALEEQEQDLDAKLKRKSSELDSIDQTLKGLHDIKRDFERNNYDSSRSYFDNDFDMTSLLVGYIAGRLDVDDVCQKVKNGHNRRVEVTYTYTPSSTTSSPFNFPSRSSSRSSSGGFGGISSRRSTGGFSSGGGGRRSTGGF